ncbi:MAG: TRAP transporter small permease [Alphaproteobacteria bacterium]|nr:TRAP transporter small permease [Alphaproteobacteria bacterium]
MLSIAVALGADLIGRELFGSGIFGAQRVAVYATIVAGLLGFALATARNMHLRVKALEKLAPAAWNGPLERIGSAVSAAICLGLAWYALLFVRETFSVGERSVTLQIAIWPIQAVLPYTFASAALRHAAFAIWPHLKPSTAGPE